jgi:hypothetical protein
LRTPADPSLGAVGAGSNAGPHFFWRNRHYILDMLDQRQQAAAEFRRTMKWILVVAVIMVAAALTYLKLTGTLTANMVIATTLGVFFSVLLGCGLFAASFFSDKSGHDQSISDATRHQRDRR